MKECSLEQKQQVRQIPCNIFISALKMDKQWLNWIELLHLQNKEEAYSISEESWISAKITFEFLHRMSSFPICRNIWAGV